MLSRCMLHTGRQLFSLQCEGLEVPENYTLLGETFQKAGYCVRQSLPDPCQKKVVHLIILLVKVSLDV